MRKLLPELMNLSAEQELEVLQHSVSRAPDSSLILEPKQTSKQSLSFRKVMPILDAFRFLLQIAETQGERS